MPLEKWRLESSFCLWCLHVLKNWIRLEDLLVRSQSKQMNTIFFFFFNSMPESQEKTERQ